MKKLAFSIVDVFAEQKFSGNQLAVFYNTGSLPDGYMQQIAREMNYSETTFVISDKKNRNGYDVRIFTPSEEVPFAGHPTLGTAYIIQREIIRRPVKKITLNLQAGQVPVAFRYKGANADKLWMKQGEPAFGTAYSIRQIAEVLCLPEAGIESRFPVQVVSTGLPFILVPLKTLEGIQAARIHRGKYFELIDGAAAKAIYIFCPQTCSGSNNIHARMFADYYGIPEDPATGSAAGCLAGYLVRYRYFGSEKIALTVEQGHEIGRPSLLYLRAEKNEGGTDIHVGGRVMMVARGELL